MIDPPGAPPASRASRRHVTPPEPAIAPPRPSSPERTELREAGATCRSCAKRPARRLGRRRGKG